MSSVPTGGNIWKNVIIGIFTTVAAYAIVHFTGIAGGEKSDEKIIKDATEKAWKSTNQYINYANEKFQTLACFSCDEQEMKKEMVRELDMYSGNLKNIKQDKSVDDKLLSVIDRIVQQFTDEKPLYENYFDSITIIKGLPESTRTEIVTSFQERFLHKIAILQTKDTSEIISYLNDINKQHKTSLKLDLPKLEVDPTLLVGKWRIECTFDIAFYKDNTLLWTESPNEFPGKWTLKDKELRINLDNGQVFDFVLLELNRKIPIYLNKENGTLLSGCLQ